MPLGNWLKIEMMIASLSLSLSLVAFGVRNKEEEEEKSTGSAASQWRKTKPVKEKMKSNSL